MITGRVQIYSDYGTESEELLFDNPNLILDGAGELICDILTVPPDSYEYGPSIFDTSNYSIQALSFGKAGLNYFSNAHSLDTLVVLGRDSIPPEIWVKQNAQSPYNHSPVLFSQEPPSPTDQKVTTIPPYYDVIVYPDGRIQTDCPPPSNPTNSINILGGVTGWGQNDSGQLNVPANLSEVVDLDAGFYHTAAVTKAGRVFCWGRNQEGQSLPPLGITNVSTIACGFSHTICSKKDGTVVSWGSNNFGERDLYVTTSSFQTFIDLAITNGHVLATFSKTFDLPGGSYTRTSLLGWGSNSNGQINIPSELIEGIIPEQAPDSIKFFNARDNLSLAIKDSTSKELYIWGGNSSDPRVEGPSFLRYNPNTNLNETVSVPWANSYEKVEIGPRHCLALRNKSGSPDAGEIYGGPNDAIVVWGPSGVFTQYPPYDLDLGRVVVPSALAGVSQSQVERIQIVKQQGNTFTENRNRVYFTSTTPDVTYVVQWPQYNTVPPYTPYGYDFFADPTSSIQDSGYLYLTKNLQVSAFPTLGCGSNSIPFPEGTGPLDDSVYTKFVTFTPCVHAYLHFFIPSEIQGKVTSIFQGVNQNGTLFGVAVTNDTSAVKWGVLQDGYVASVEWLGTGFTKVVGDNDSNYWKLLKNDGNFLDFYGNLPMDPSGVEIKYNTSSSPTGIKKVAAASRYSLGLTVDGKLYSTGQLSIPEQIQSATISDMSAGELHALVLLADGTVSSFGNNSFGQENIPVGLTNVVEIAAGHYHNVVMKSDGSVICWGKNDEGQCDVPAGLVAKAISAGGQHTTVITTNDDIIIFGRTAEGQDNVPEYADTSALDYTFIPQKIASGYKFNLALYDLNLSSYSQVSDTEIDPSGPFIDQLSTQVYNSYKYGQNVNLLPFIGKPIDLLYTSSGAREITLSANQAYLEGSFAPSSSWTARVVSGNTTNYNTIESYTWPGDTQNSPTAGTLNGRGVVDFRGYILKKSGGLQQTGVSPTQGKITYSLGVPVPDKIAFDCYGGITSIGLWALDMKKMLNKNKLPPYTFNLHPTDNENLTFENPIDFKLFAKKVYDVNIVRQPATTNNFFLRENRLLINWTLNFM